MVEINLSEIRNTYRKAPQFASQGTHEAYIVQLFFTSRKFTVGVNYWTKEEAAIGDRIMEGNCRCKIIAPLYES